MCLPSAVASRLSPQCSSAADSCRVCRWSRFSDVQVNRCAGRAHVTRATAFLQGPARDKCLEACRANVLVCRPRARGEIPREALEIPEIPEGNYRSSARCGVFPLPTIHWSTLAKKPPAARAADAQVTEETAGSIVRIRMCTIINLRPQPDARPPALPAYCLPSSISVRSSYPTWAAATAVSSAWS